MENASSAILELVFKRERIRMSEMMDWEEKGREEEKREWKKRGSGKFLVLSRVSLWM